MKYLVWLNEIMGAGNAHSKKALEYFGSAQKIYNAAKDERIKSGVFSKAEISKLSKTPLSVAVDILNCCKAEGISVLGYGSREYPSALSVIENPPVVLYVKGKIPDFGNIPSVAVVGPRNVSEYGKKAAYSLSFRLARAGFIIVSGGALGCDTYAHAGALKTDGVTVQVMGCGICADYLKENKALRENICKNGCLISEYSPKAMATRYSFPTRNRIIAGLTLGTVLIEAGEKSGGLITARLANEQGRDVFVIPGSPDKAEYKGSNALLRDGAKALIDLSDIFGEYIARFPDKINIERAFDSKILERPKEAKTEISENISKNFSIALSKEAKIVYNCIDSEKFLPEEIKNTGLSSGQLLSALTELEMEALIETIPGGMYRLVK